MDTLATFTLGNSCTGNLYFAANFGNALQTYIVLAVLLMLLINPNVVIRHAFCSTFRFAQQTPYKHTKMRAKKCATLHAFKGAFTMQRPVHSNECGALCTAHINT